MKRTIAHIFTALSICIFLLPMQRAEAECMIGEVTMFAGNFAPRNYALAQGQLLSIAQNNTLFSILGTTFGGDGRTTFALPDLRGRVPLGTGMGSGLTRRRLGQQGGVEATSQLIAHTHAATLHANTTNGVTNNPSDSSLSKSGYGDVRAPTPVNTYSTSIPNVAMREGSVTIASSGSGSTVSVMQPYNTLNYIICMQGVYPARN